MNRSLIRWILVALMAVSLLFTLSCPFIAEAEGSVLPLDYKEGGKPLKEDNWVLEGKNACLLQRFHH